MKIGRIRSFQSLPPLEAALQREAADLERAIATDPRQQRLKIVRDTLDQLQIVREAHATRRAYKQADSVLDGAEYAMEDENRPLTLAELMDLLPRYGKVPGGNKPNWNLSNQLSGNKTRFQSVDWNGEKHWWLAGRETPN